MTVQEFMDNPKTSVHYKSLANRILSLKEKGVTVAVNLSNRGLDGASANSYVMIPQNSTWDDIEKIVIEHENKLELKPVLLLAEIGVIVKY